jgi:tRNA pseudouridine synthase 10
MASTELYKERPKRGTTQLKRLAIHGQYTPARQFLEKEGINHLEPSEPCFICQGVMDQLDDAADVVIKELKDWQTESILIGSKVIASMVEREEQLRSEFEIQTGEPIKAEINREVGKLVTERLSLPVDFTSPDIVAIIQVPKFRVTLQVASIYVYGKYQKLVRGIPQTRWPCRECHGKGCQRCKGSGKMYDESVEELIAPTLLNAFNGSGVKFHGAGREDIDARMLGDGRPFVIEILNPHLRSAKLQKAEDRINKDAQGKIKITGLRPANKAVVKSLKLSATASKKVYKALVQVESPIQQEELLALERVPMPLEVKQQTPQRVLHRRADRIRKKRIYTLKTEFKDAKSFELVIECQGGLYIKEFISGDEGRTTPSLTELLSNPAICLELDVLNVAISEEALPW